MCETITAICKAFFCQSLNTVFQSKCVQQTAFTDIEHVGIQIFYRTGDGQVSNARIASDKGIAQIGYTVGYLQFSGNVGAIECGSINTANTGIHVDRLQIGASVKYGRPYISVQICSGNAGASQKGAGFYYHQGFWQHDQAQVRTILCKIFWKSCNLCKLKLDAFQAGAASKSIGIHAG